MFQNNLVQEPGNSLVADAKSEWVRLRRRSNRNSELEIHHELGYTHLFDSLWYRNADRLHISYRYASGSNIIRKTFHSVIETGLFKAYEQLIDPNTGHRVRTVNSEFLYPASWETGFGVLFEKGPFNNIGLSMSTARIKTIHTASQIHPPDGFELFRTCTGAAWFNYGFSLQFQYTQTRIDPVTFSVRGKLFVTGLRKDQLDGETALQLRIQLTRRIQLRAESRMVYDPAMSLQLRFRNEILTGLYYEKVR